MGLALFDLDNTLLAGDSDHAWGEYLIKHGLVDPIRHAQVNDSFYADYCSGSLDIHAYVRFTLGPIMSQSIDQLVEMHREFMSEFIEPIILPKAIKLVDSHKAQGDVTVIITATNSFVTGPIAKRFGVDALIGTDLATNNDRFTGEILGTPCFQDGKVVKLKAWLESMTNSANQDQSLRIDDAVFYSDSINDLPLLASVAKPVVVDGDQRLRSEATQRNWQQISLRD